MSDPKDDYLCIKWLEGNRAVTVIPLTFGRARITVSPDFYSIDDSW